MTDEKMKPDASTCPQGRMEALVGPGDNMEPRKIQLPDYCCPFDIATSGGDPNCDHDYPPESKNERTDGVTWTCSLCGMRTNFGVYD